MSKKQEYYVVFLICYVSVDCLVPIGIQVPTKT